MSREERLKRLGLWHLRDQPEALQRELARRIAQRDVQERQEEERRLEELEMLRELEDLGGAAGGR